MRQPHLLPGFLIVHQCAILVIEIFLSEHEVGRPYRDHVTFGQQRLCCYSPVVTMTEAMWSFLSSFIYEAL